MGAGILPTAIYKNKLYFLFGKENKYEDSAPGFSDFGGGTDNTESLFETAVREACEELTGFLGDEHEIRKMLKNKGTYNIDHTSKYNNKMSTYRTHIFPYEYNEYLPQYYNNNQRFLQRKLDPKIIQSTKIFEKAEIRWVCVDELNRMRDKFRNYYRNIIDIIISQKNDIKQFLKNKTKTKTKTKKII